MIALLDSTPRPRGERLAHIDALRGLALVLLVLEAARQYFHGAIYVSGALDVESTTPAIYFTKWATHISAPILALLAGVSAHIRLARDGDRARLSRFLFTRGLMIVFLELSVVAFGRNFAVFPILFAAFGTIGCAMIALAALIWLPRRFVLGLAMLTLLASPLLERLQAWHFGPLGLVWQMLDEPLVLLRDGRLLALVDYSFIPWTAIVMLGYGIGPVFAGEPGRRDRILLWSGAVLIAAFLIVRLSNLFGDPVAWSSEGDLSRSIMSFMNVEKFPPSLLYVSVTLGLVFLLTPLVARVKGMPLAVLRAFGAAPMLGYVLHFYVAHGLALIVALLVGQAATPLIHQISYLVEGRRDLSVGFDLGGVYLAWLAALALLFPLCRWWADLKTRRPDWWLSYL